MKGEKKKKEVIATRTGGKWFVLFQISHDMVMHSAQQSQIRTWLALALHL